MLTTLNKTEVAILDVLESNGETYGWDVSDLSGGKVNKRSVYVWLNALEGKGYVSCREVPHDIHIGMPKRLYTITQDGTRAKSEHEVNAINADIRGS